MRALIVDDDPVAAKLIQSAIEHQFLVEHTETGEDAVELVKLYDFDIVILDLRLPDVDGGEVVRRLRASDVVVPVLILSGVEDRHEKVRGLVCGADDYLTKPFDKEELSARLQAIVRRSKGHAASTIRVGRMTIDLNAKRVEIDGKPLHVTGKEYSILELLSLRKGMTLTKETFLDHLYGGMDEPEQKIIDVFICKLRKKIATLTGEHHNIETVWGRGYMLRDGQDSHAGLNESRAPWGADALEAEDLTELDRLILTLLPGGPAEETDGGRASG
jgi:two-component system cell cycle response regulator CtrA